ncbi:hypothetical protein E1A91_A06G142800v1 [Gossypium mustelinum]|uniref:Uncharacterized protein n=1 Tax=Gossypium mustelinum TaxID=34275 RepID=A0A5D2YVN3_GOSMU|nr:hypothetical protein E1A91_A06G142800v1 [Gossypium mustelinum]
MALIIQSLTKTHSPQNQLARVSNIYRIHHFIWWLMVYQQRLDPIHAHGDSMFGLSSATTQPPLQHHN